MQIKHLRICSGTDSETVPVHLEINLFLLTIKKSISKTKMHRFCAWDGIKLKLIQIFFNTIKI